MLPDHAIDPDAIRWIGTEDHRTCDQQCRGAAVPTPYDRERPPMVACPWCGAAPGVACQVVSSRGRRNRQPLVTFGRNHPSRLEAA